MLVKKENPFCFCSARSSVSTKQSRIRLSAATSSAVARAPRSDHQLPRGKKALPNNVRQTWHQDVPWVTFGEQVRVISRFSRNFRAGQGAPCGAAVTAAAT